MMKESRKEKMKNKTSFWHWKFEDIRIPEGNNGINKQETDR